MLNICFLTSQFAGITYSFKYSINIYNDIVKKLKQSQSAGNNIIGTSETLCDEIIENIKPISIHVPKHLKPLNDNEFGYYLAGLIDGHGHLNLNLSKQKELVIVFHSLDVSLAYYIKSKIGFGNVKSVKNKNAYLYIISNKLGIIKVLNLINGKIRTINIYNQIINIYSENNIVFNMDNSNNLDNYWLTGFTDALGSFQIKIISNKNNKLEVRLNYEIDQKDNKILLLIKDFIGGNIYYNQDRYYYGSTSFGSAKNLINYFDKYHLLSSKHINYLKWRKSYIIIQNRDHLKDEGLVKIKKFKNSMIRFNVK